MIINKYKCSKFKEIIMDDNFIWNEEDLNSFMKNHENPNDSKIAEAYIYEKKENWEASLKIWQEFGVKREEEFELSKEACERTKNILSNPNRIILKDYPILNL